MTARTRKISITTIVGLLLIGLAGSVSAYWSTLGSGSGTASTATLNAPGTPTFLQMSETSVDISWTAPENSAPVTLYKVFRTGTEAFICQASPPSTTCSDNTIAPSTTYTYTVTAYAGSWTATSPSAQYTTNAPAPAPGAPVITFPTNGATYTTAAAWDAGCAPGSPGICGTAAAASGQTLQMVEFSLKQGSLYWNGTSFASATEVWNLADGTTSWAKAFAFPAVGSYVLSVKATDSRPVVSATTTVSFTVGTPAPSDTTAPLISRIALAPIVNTTTQGFLGQGVQYYVYANITDAGSGVATAATNVSNITTGSSAVSLVSGSYTAFGNTYNYRSGVITANASIPAGSTPSYTVTATDVAGNTTSPAAQSTITIDNTAPTGLTITFESRPGQAARFSGGAGRATNDILTVTVTVCATNSFPCAAPQAVLTGSVTGSGATGTYVTNDSGNLGNKVKHFAQAVQLDNAGNRAVATTPQFET